EEVLVLTAAVLEELLGEEVPVVLERELGGTRRQRGQAHVLRERARLCGETQTRRHERHALAVGRQRQAEVPDDAAVTLDRETRDARQEAALDLEAPVDDRTRREAHRAVPVEREGRRR